MLFHSSLGRNIGLFLHSALEWTELQSLLHVVFRAIGQEFDLGVVHFDIVDEELRAVR